MAIKQRTGAADMEGQAILFVFVGNLGTADCVKTNFSHENEISVSSFDYKLHYAIKFRE